MGQVSVFLHKAIENYCQDISDLLETSRSSVIEDMIKYIKDNELEEEVWGDAYMEALEALEEEGEESEEEEEGIEEELEEEEEEGEGDS